MFGWALLAVGGGCLAGAFDLSTGHDLLHLLSGLAALVASRSYPRARLSALVFGAVYVAAAAFGVGGGEGAVLHALVGATGLAAGLATPGRPAPTTA